MGYTTTHSICVGFRFSYEEITKPFATNVPEEFHMEPRFDSKTGNSIGEERVVDKHGYTVFNIGDFEYDDYESLIDTISASCRCEWGLLGSHCMSMEKNEIVIYVQMPQEIDTGDGCDIYGSFKFDDTVKLQPKLNTLRKNLESLGLDLTNKDAEVILLWTHS